MAGEIHLILDGAKILPKEAIEPLNKTTQWKSIKLLKRKTPGLEDLKAAKKLGQDLFGSLGPEGTDALSQFLRQNLTGWRKDLTSFKPLADTGNYPGKAEIQGADANGALYGALELAERVQRRGADALRGPAVKGKPFLRDRGWNLFLTLPWNYAAHDTVGFTTACAAILGITVDVTGADFTDTCVA